MEKCSSVTCIILLFVSVFTLSQPKFNIRKIYILFLKARFHCQLTLYCPITVRKDASRRCLCLLS